LRTRRGDPGAAETLDEALALASQTRTLQRVAPVRAARAEAAWLGGNLDLALSEAQVDYELAVAKRHAWFTGELAYWQWKAGGLGDAPPWIARPFKLQIQGAWAEAAEAWRDRRCPYEAARALAESDVEAPLREALAEFMRLGASPAAQRVRQELHSLGVRGLTRGPRSSTLENPAQLTQRELEVLRLVADGLHNAEIAQRLFLSRRTVDHHVSAILRKLGARTRLEAVGHAERLSLLARR
jgi:DNA-binding CsgD family transcriptional regulator